MGQISHPLLKLRPALAARDDDICDHRNSLGSPVIWVRGWQTSPAKSIAWETPARSIPWEFLGNLQEHPGSVSSKLRELGRAKEPGDLRRPYSLFSDSLYRLDSIGFYGFSRNFPRLLQTSCESRKLHSSVGARTGMIDDDHEVLACHKCARRNPRGSRPSPCSTICVLLDSGENVLANIVDLNVCLGASLAFCEPKGNALGSLLGPSSEHVCD